MAGGTQGQIAVYDIESRQTTLRLTAHDDDVNAVSFADASSSNLLLSGSDDTFIKVWDRRSLSSERASGTLVGHTEGVTFLASTLLSTSSSDLFSLRLRFTYLLIHFSSGKGDGRYVVSNGKDQTMRLFDLRKMVSDERFTDLRLDKVSYSIKNWDYRYVHPSSTLIYSSFS